MPADLPGQRDTSYTGEAVGRCAPGEPSGDMDVASEPAHGRALFGVFPRRIPPCRTPDEKSTLLPVRARLYTARMTENMVDIDVVILGGGCAGLWALNVLRG
ncbi:MAG: hypothetical protein ACPG1A_02625, partial [Halioglobus sp.]